MLIQGTAYAHLPSFSSLSEEIFFYSKRTLQTEMKKKVKSSSSIKRV